MHAHVHVTTVLWISGYSGYRYWVNLVIPHTFIPLNNISEISIDMNRECAPDLLAIPQLLQLPQSSPYSLVSLARPFPPLLLLCTSTY